MKQRLLEARGPYPHCRNLQKKVVGDEVKKEVKKPNLKKPLSWRLGLLKEERA